MLNYFQNCSIFLCGTKLDLTKKDRKARQVDHQSTKDYAKSEKRLIHSWVKKLFFTGSLMFIFLLLRNSCRGF